MDDLYYMRSKFFENGEYPNMKDMKGGSRLLKMYDVSKIIADNDERLNKTVKSNRIVSGIKNFFVDFCNETTIHGFNHMVAPGRHILEKIGWIIITALAALGAMQLCRQQWQRFIESPTVVSLEKDYRTWNNTFPAITACIEERINTTSAVKIIEKLWGVKENDEKFEYYMRFITAVANATMKNLGIFEEFENDNTLKSVDLFKIATDVTIPFVVKSNWFDTSLNISLVKVMTDLGVCYTINSVVSRNQAISQTASDNVSMLVDPVTCSFETHPCYVKLESHHICVRYYIHSPYEIVDKTNTMAAQACPSQDFDTDWKVTETKSSEDVKALAINRRNCRYHDEPLNGKHEVYSAGICRRECRNALALKSCGCRPFFNFQENGPQCSVSGMICLAKQENLLKESCNCLPSCIDATYELANIKETRWKGLFGTRCAIKAGILAPRSRYRRQILFYFEDLVVSFGGAAGLFLGCSFLSGVEIIYFILERIGSAVLKIFRCKKNVQNNEESNGENEDNIRRPKFENPLNAIENRERYGMKKFINQIAEYD